MTRILCVEDNEDNLFMLQRRLTRAGFEVTISRDGEKALAAGCDEFALKPIDFPGLVEKIRRSAKP